MTLLIFRVITLFGFEIFDDIVSPPREPISVYKEQSDADTTDFEVEATSLVIIGNSDSESSSSLSTLLNRIGGILLLLSLSLSIVVGNTFSIKFDARFLNERLLLLLGLIRLPLLLVKLLRVLSIIP